jgi:hypothetical protein
MEAAHGGQAVHDVPVTSFPAASLGVSVPCLYYRMELRKVKGEGAKGWGSKGLTGNRNGLFGHQHGALGVPCQECPGLLRETHFRPCLIMGRSEGHGWLLSSGLASVLTLPDRREPHT